MKDYSNYIFKKTEWLLGAIKSLILGITASRLIYKSFFGMLLIPIIFPIVMQRQKQIQCEKQKTKLLREFKDGMQSVVVALQAGYSMENAWKESEKEITELYGEDALFVSELRRINAAVDMNQPIEKLLYEFADRSHCEDIRDFAEVFLFAKRSGGDFCKIMQTTIRHIGEKMEVESEIQTIISAKRMEQKIMNIMPVMLLGYLNLTASDFLQPLYGNAVGTIIMTGAFLLYITAVFISEKIMRIKV